LSGIWTNGILSVTDLKMHNILKYLQFRYTSIKKPLDFKNVTSGRTILVKIKHAELRPGNKSVIVS
jgi:N-acyl-L-homoserine lactone synthetase